MKKQRNTFIKEPIFLFFAMGILLYALYTFLNAQFDKKNKTITVSNAQVALLSETFKKTWNRAPTEKETKAQIDNFIKDEVFFKEAVAMGLDKSDPAVKRRLRQLMELMMDDAATVYPSEEQLKKYLNEHPDKFREDPTISFKHVYFQLDQKQDAENQLSNLVSNLPVDQSKVSHLSLIPDRFDKESKFFIDRQFGKFFASEIFALEPGRWLGPVESAYGWHLIYISDITPGKVPELSDIWDSVEREWSNEQKTVKKDNQYQKMKAKYDIEFEHAE